MQREASPPESAYIHIPFCISKCHYCDFNSYSCLGNLFGDYALALIREIELAASDSSVDTPLKTIYFGGGTPTLLDPAHLINILGALRNFIGIADDAEITIEANPGTVDDYKLKLLRSSGFNRLSIGCQSFDDSLLAVLGRAHTAKQAFDAYDAARIAGFSNISLDLMFALPGQSIEQWGSALSIAVDMNPEHISLYELSIEEGTRYAELFASGELALPDEDVRLNMYELAIEKLSSAGYEHYEVSNFGKPGFHSRHNKVYWRNEPYYGFGAGATSFINGVRARRIPHPSAYIDAVRSGRNLIEYSEKLAGRAHAAETIMLGLRMLEGIDLNELSVRTNVNIRAEFACEIANLKKKELIELDGSNLRVTRKGLLLLNDVSREFVSLE